MLHELSVRFVALGQIALYTIMLTLSISEDYNDYQVAFGSAWMILITAVYLGLTGRVLFLLFERRYEEAKGPEWLWWLASMVVVMFNIMLIVWFSLVSDVIPATICGVATFLYILFFKFASKDIKRIGDNDPRARTRKNQPPSRESSRPSSRISARSEASTRTSEPIVPK
ncbi:uncharacterized protein LOC135195911 isoform X2 [Macrobrachium nipponense]|uniref:uncharacterized protein LOC135195911 isoform X2 n=1 Tax=Macrobrachium nipponense TaxID=159736 RepID=UPI0030C87C87